MRKTLTRHEVQLWAWLKTFAPTVSASAAKRPVLRREGFPVLRFWDGALGGGPDKVRDLILRARPPP